MKAIDWKDYGRTSLVLGVSKALLVPTTQPMQVVMRHQQGQLSNGLTLSAKRALQDLYRGSPKTLGIPTGLFRGWVSAMTKEAIKNGSYKGIAFKGAPTLVKTYVTPPCVCSNVTQHCMISGLAAMVAATADTFIGGPFERYATHRATSQGHYNNAKFLSELNTRASPLQKVRFIYKGSSATFIKTAIACTALFGGSVPIQQYTYQAFGLKTGDDVPLEASCMAAVSTGGLVAIVSSPFDIAKTILQRPSADEHLRTLDILRQNITRFGIRGMTAGLPIKFFLTLIGWTTVSVVTQQGSTVRAYELHTF